MIFKFLFSSNYINIFFNLKKEIINKNSKNNNN